MVELEERNGRYVYNYKDSGKTVGYSGGKFRIIYFDFLMFYCKNFNLGSVAGFIIGFLIVGLVIGLVGGVFLILKRGSSAGASTRMSSFNPNFSKSGSDDA